MSSHADRHSIFFLAVSLLALAIFLLATQFHLPPDKRRQHAIFGEVVIDAPIQILMYAGDRFLAANLEEMRIAAIGPEDNESLVAYRLRAHELVAQLNPCHEDNYYMANAMLTWGGSTKEGNAILESATECRFWDEFPPFFLGFNHYFFDSDLDSAQKAIDLAATRSTLNRSSLQAISIAIATRKLNDEKMAVAYLRKQRDETKDKQLAASLDRRLRRLEGLISLRDAQKKFEEKYGHPLTNPDDLLSSGILNTVPQDPMRIGYEFVDGRFRLRALNIGGVEIR